LVAVSYETAGGAPVRVAVPGGRRNAFATACHSVAVLDQTAATVRVAPPPLAPET